MWVSRKKYNRLKEELISLRDEKQHIKNKLEAYQKAKDKDCKIGEYCKICAFSHKEIEFIDYAIFNANSIKKAEHYICGFDCCKHFERKEKVVL